MTINFDKVNPESRDILKEHVKMGRKPKPKDELKSEKITINLTKEEKEIIEAKARAVYMPVGRYVVMQALKG